jgi:hypothetical protein
MFIFQQVTKASLEQLPQWGMLKRGLKREMEGIYRQVADTYPTKEGEKRRVFSPIHGDKKANKRRLAKKRAPFSAKKLRKNSC